jgi:hypothetical protein
VLKRVPVIIKIKRSDGTIAKFHATRFKEEKKKRENDSR